MTLALKKSMASSMISGPFSVEGGGRGVVSLGGGREGEKWGRGKVGEGGEAI